MQKEEKQHKIFVIGFFLIVIVVLWFLVKPFVSGWQSRQKNSAERKANEEILKAPSIMPDDLFKKIEGKSEIFLVDISNPEDFSRGHIAESVNTPAEMLNRDFLNNLGATETADVFIINQGNNLEELAIAVNEAISAGFSNAKYLRGGISGWREKGYPLVSSGGSENDRAKVKKITFDEIKKEAETNPDLLQFLDVREQGAFSKEHIIGSINIPISELESKRGEVPILKKIIVYGDNENESFQAAVILFDLNFFNAYQMSGSIEEWKASGGNTESRI